MKDICDGKVLLDYQLQAEGARDMSVSSSDSEEWCDAADGVEESVRKAGFFLSSVGPVSRGLIVTGASRLSGVRGRFLKEALCAWSEI